MRKVMMSGFCLAVFLCGCAHAPCWVKRGPACTDKCKTGLCGDGLAEPTIKSKALREEAAENRARAKMLSVLEARITQIMKDYIGPEGELVERALRTIGKGAISGAKLIDRYTEGDGSVRALMRLDPEEFKKALERYKGLNKEAREFIRNRTDDLLTEAESK